ncbi:tyrosine-type recombinase/integrase [Brevundimonas naejangsanensis]|uniref:tyrosine-type recombinase/integrase n=1 Tax=Brevundimonas naejangsanensis TaxID=588932 RepID=UPI0012DEB248|nr:tyrosine-type recombinase/integrase [Brevundimonas naejangsanensis]
MATKRVSIPGTHRIVKRHSDGRVTIYWYRHRGGPQLIAFSGASLSDAERIEAASSNELLAAYMAKAASSHGGETIGSLVKLYREVPEGLQALAITTRSQWVRWLDRIEVDLGDFPLKLLKAKGARRTFTEWRDRFASTPRQADYAIQVLRRVLAVGVEREVIAENPAVGIKQLYRANRADVILSSEELEVVLAKATPHARYAIRLAAATGLRRGDLVALRWDQVHGNRVELSTKKSGGRTFVIAPLVGDGAAVVEELRLERERQIAEGRVPSAFVLTTERRTAWLGPSLTQAFIRAAKDAGVSKALHDLRGTAATRYIRSGFSPQEVASFLGWERSRVDQIIRRYVDPDLIARDAIERLELKRVTG